MFSRRIHLRNSLRMETLEQRRLLTIAIHPGLAPEVPVEPVEPITTTQPNPAEVKTIRLREDSESGIEFDDTRLGNIFVNHAVGDERYITISQRADGRREHAVIGFANLFDALPGAVDHRAIEIISATLSISSKWESGQGSSVSVHPIVSHWLRHPAGQNETDASLYEASHWVQAEFGPSDYSNLSTVIQLATGRNAIDVTAALQNIYASGVNQGFAIVPHSGPHGPEVDVLISASDHWIPDERPTFDIKYRYVTESPHPIDLSPVEPNPAEPDEEQNSSGKLSSTTRVLSESIQNPGNPSIPLTRYYSEVDGLDVMSHGQSGELTGFSPDGKWHHILMGYENWYLRNVETGEIRFAHHVTAGQANNGYFQWTERNNYLRFGGPDVLEEVDPETRLVVNSTRLTVATFAVDDAAEVDYAEFRSGQSSGADGIYVEQRVSLNESAEQRWFINVIDTSNGGLREKYFYEFDASVHNDDATANRWRELYFTNQTFNVHLNPFGRPGTGTNGEGGDVYYNFAENGDGGTWQQVSLVENSSAQVLREAQSHRTLETIAGTTYVAYSTWRGRDNFVIVAEQVSGREVAAIQISNTQFAVHLQFFQNEVVYAIAEVAEPSEPVEYLQVEAVAVDVHAGTAGPRRKIANVNAIKDGKFHTHARPFADGRGNYCWHTNEFSTTDTIDLVCTNSSASSSLPETLPKQPSPKATDDVFSAFLSLSRDFDKASESGDVDRLGSLKKLELLMRRKA